MAGKEEQILNGGWVEVPFVVPYELRIKLYELRSGEQYRFTNEAYPQLPLFRTTAYEVVHQEPNVVALEQVESSSEHSL